MYYIYDYVTGNVHQFTTKEELILWWKKHVGKHNFDELNVTGVDCHMTEPDMYYDSESQRYITTYKRLPTPVIKRYVILDENGRHIDIREWDDGLWAYKPPCKSFRETHPELYSGKKHKWRRIKSASFNHRDRRDYTSLDEDDLPDNFSIKNVIRNRPLNSIQAWDCAEKRQMNKGRKPKCWKDQTKCDRQYARHKNNKRTYSEHLPDHDTAEEDRQLAEVLRETDCVEINGQIPA